MKNPKNIAIKDYTYELPIEKIAQLPLEKRDDSKLLISNDGELIDTIFSNIDKYIPENSLMIFNDTKVIQARLIFKKQTGSSIELFCLEPYKFNGETSLAFQQKGACLWACFVGNLKKWKNETLKKTIQINGNDVTIYADKLKVEADTVVVSFKWEPIDITFAEVMELFGLVPLPPYITRKVVKSDKQRYQTIYANIDGSVAAPTAGLHFTADVFCKLEAKKIKKQNVTLHVGAGTFKPVSTTTMIDHVMHAERILVNIHLIENIILNLNNNIICVGTTSVRTIESFYWFGVKLILSDKNIQEINVNQWEPYDLDENINISAEKSLKAILNMMKSNNLNSISGYTQLIILPNYKYRIVNGIITNFHQPQSTLLLLVAAFLGDFWKNIYQYALNNNFRFLSYGDCCFFLKNKNK